MILSPRSAGSDADLHLSIHVVPPTASHWQTVNYELQTGCGGAHVIITNACAAFNDHGEQSNGNSRDQILTLQSLEVLAEMHDCRWRAVREKSHRVRLCNEWGQILTSLGHFDNCITLTMVIIPGYASPFLS